MNDDVVVTATLFQSQIKRQDVLLFNEALKAAKKFLFDDFPPITREIAQHQAALFVRTTDIINFKEMEKVIAQLNAPEAETTNMISFGPRKAYNVKDEGQGTNNFDFLLRFVVKIKYRTLSITIFSPSKHFFEKIVP